MTERLYKKSVLLLRARVSFICVLLSAVLFLFLRRKAAVLALLLAAIFIILIIAFFVYIPLYFRRFCITKNSGTIEIKKGIILRDTVKIRKEKIVGVRCFSSPLQRLLKIKTVTLKTSARAVRFLACE